MINKEEKPEQVSNGESVTFAREWAMPDKNTFDIKPIGELVEMAMNESGGLWIDPFAGKADYADITNDLNPDIDTDYSMKALEFLSGFDTSEVDGGVLFDPPYSPRQIKECYDSVGIEITQETTQATFWSDVKEEIQRICAPESTVVTCGWNSGGVGKTRGFDLQHILMVPHGGWHNDTIVTIEKRTDKSGKVSDTFEVETDSDDPLEW